MMGSLATVDGESLPAMFDVLKSDGVKCSVVGLAAEMFICKRMCSTTGGGSFWWGRQGELVDM